MSNHTEFTMFNLNTFSKICLRLRVFTIVKESYHIGELPEIQLNLNNPLAWVAAICVYYVDGREELLKIM